MLVYELAALVLGRRRLHRVTGTSMRPALRDGDLVVVDPNGRAPRPGDLVVARPPFQPVDIVKRVATVDRLGRVRVVGDQPDRSTDSRSFGAIPPERVVGRVTGRLR